MLALMITIIFCFLLLGIGEFYCRYFTRIHFNGNSYNLFVPNRFGESIGNLVNGKAVSFGAVCYTDENGFRIDPAFKDTNSDKAILLCGDSVGFGCGVEENQTASGLLRQALPDIRFYNSCCIGYWNKDYKNVVDLFVPAHPNVKYVYIIMCINDTYNKSSVEIRKHLGEDPKQAVKQDAVTMAKNYAFLEDINIWLRSRSKLYLLLKNLVSDTSMRIFSYDLEMYKNSKAYFEVNMNVFKQMSDQLQSRGIGFKVIIMPYEAQLRSRNDAFMLPQHMITNYFLTQGIDFIDASEDFRNADVPSKQLYLYGDPMHLSSVGHRVLYNILINDIGAIEQETPR